MSNRGKIISIPEANYLPWEDDQEFKKVFAAARTSTLIDTPRNYELWRLAKQVAHKPGSAMEVGIFKGGSACVISTALANSCNIYLCDTFRGVVKAEYEADPCYKGGEHSFNDKNHILQLITSQAGTIENIKILDGIFPEDTADQIPADEQFKFAHIDVDVYRGTKDIVNWLWPRLVIGGIIVIDDYGLWQCGGIALAVNELLYQQDKIIIYNLNGQATIIKVS